MPLPSGWTTQTLLGVLRSIRAAVDGMPSLHVEYERLANITPQLVLRIEDEVREMEAKSRRVESHLEMIARRHGASEVDRARIADYLATGLQSPALFDELVNSLSFATTPRFERDQQVAKVRQLISRIVLIRDGLGLDANSRYVLSVGDQAKELFAQRQRVLAEIQRIPRVTLVNVTSENGRPIQKIEATISRMNLLADVGTKLYTAVDWIRKLTGGA